MHADALWSTEQRQRHDKESRKPIYNQLLKWNKYSMGKIHLAAILCTLTSDNSKTSKNRGT